MGVRHRCNAPEFWTLYWRCRRAAGLLSWDEDPRTARFYIFQTVLWTLMKRGMKYGESWHQGEGLVACGISAEEPARRGEALQREDREEGNAWAPLARVSPSDLAPGWVWGGQWKKPRVSPVLWKPIYLKHIHSLVLLLKYGQPWLYFYLHLFFPPLND